MSFDLKDIDVGIIPIVVLARKSLINQYKQDICIWNMENFKKDQHQAPLYKLLLIHHPTTFYDPEYSVLQGSVKLENGFLLLCNTS